MAHSEGRPPILGESKSIKITIKITPTCKRWIEAQPKGGFQALIETLARENQIPEVK